MGREEEQKKKEKKEKKKEFWTGPDKAGIPSLMKTHTQSKSDIRHWQQVASKLALWMTQANVVQNCQIYSAQISWKALCL